MPKYLEGIQTIERQEPIPQLLLTIPAAQFISNTTKTVELKKVLKRHASERTLIIASSLNQPFSSMNIYTRDTIYGDNTVGILTEIGTAGKQLQAYGVSIIPSRVSTHLGGNFDSLHMQLGIGATAPTVGDVKIYIIEVL